MKQYAVYHVEKGNISSGGIGNHIDRVRGKEHSYPHADVKRRGENITWRLRNDYHLMKLSDAIEHRIKEGYTSTRKIRANTVKYCTHILTGSHDRMTEIAKDPEKLKQWLFFNLEFLKERYGEENIVRFTCHMDEKTPHIHAVTVPLTADGRLSAKEVIGNKTKMQETQDLYAEYMEHFGLKRGIKNTGIKHEDAKAYYARIKQAQNISTDLAPLMKQNLFGRELDPNKVKDALNALKTALHDTEKENIDNRELRKDIRYYKRFAEQKLEENFSLHDEKKEIAKKVKEETINMLLENPKQYAELWRERERKREQEEERKKRMIQEEENRSKRRGFRL